MADNFDKQQAATDLKQLLKMNDKTKLMGQSSAPHSGSGKNTGNVEAESAASSSKFSNTHANSNGNALLTAAMQNQPAPVLLKQGNHTEAGGSDDMADNSRTQHPSKSKNSKKVKNAKKSKNGSPKNPDVPDSVGEANSPVPSKNSLASKSQNKHNERVKDGAEVSNRSQHFQNGNRGNDSGSTQYQGVKRGDHSSYVINAKAQHVKLGEPDISSDFLLLMEENRIHLLKKRSVKFPKAKFFCRLCDYHMELLEDCDNHMKDNKHSRRKEINAVDAKLRTLPKPTDQQIAALTAAVDNVYEEHGISEKEQEQRAGVVSRLEKMLQQQIPDVVMFMYGSSLTGFGLKTADINVNLTSANMNKKLTTLLLEVHDSLNSRTGCGFSNVRSDFNAKVPGLLLTDDHSGWTVHVVIHCYSAHCSSELLSMYSAFDVRVRKLAVAFRYWAHTCQFEGQDEFIPAQALNLMLIYFLQHITPQVVPIVQPPKVSGDDVGDFRKDLPKFQKMRSKVLNVKLEKSNNMSVGELWLSLLRFYSLEFDAPNAVVSIRSNQEIPRTTKPWNNKKLAVEDPYMLKKNITRAVGNSHLYEYWQDSIRRALRYFGLPRTSADKMFFPLQEHKKMAHDSKRTSQPLELREQDKENAVDSCVHDGKVKKVDSVNAESVDSNKRDLPDKKEKPIDKDSNSPVVIAPNPLLLGRVIHPSKVDHLQCDPHIENGGHTLDGPSQDAKPSSTPAHGSVFKASSKDSDIQGPNSTAASDVSSHELNKTQPLVASDATILLDSSLKPVASSHQSSLVSSLEQLSVDSSKDVSSHVVSPQLVCNVDSSEKATNDALCPNLPDDVVNNSSEERNNARSDTFVCESETAIAGISDGGHSDTVAERDAEDLKSVQPQPEHRGSGNINQFKDTDSQVQLIHVGPEESSSKFNPELTHSELSDKLGSQLAPKEASADRSGAKDNGTEQREKISPVIQSGCYYEFSRENLTDGKGPTLMCAFCDKEGHLKNDCPDNNLPEVDTLPPLTPFHIKVLSDTLSKVPAEVGLSGERLVEREVFMRGLEEFIQVQFTDAKLSLFGSSCNGFGFDKSDMDICLTFTQRKIGDKVMVIESLAKKMKQHLDLTNVQSIPTAKVPIVKFTVKKTGLEGDISLYNTLAEQNTKLLLCYNKIDPRVNILGYAIKTFAKVCDIGDASRGSLSSYAYILMMLYYLQQVEPPVIPVLQELYRGDKKPERLVEGWDAWFQDDLSLLDELWPEKGKNSMSVAELWLGFLCFYVEEFKYKEHVVSIRQRKPLTRFEKLWNGPCIAIEDPFDLSHNLGSALTRTMNNFILKTFINGRMLYGSPIDENMDMFNKYQRPSDYFFDTDLLSESRPPNVRGCRRCGKVGHLVRHCPAILKDKEDEQKRLQQQQQKQQQQKQVQQEWSSSSQQQYSKRPQQQQQHQKQLQSQRTPLPQVQPQRTHMQQQQNDRDMRDRRELDRIQYDPNANKNRNSASGLGHNFKLPFQAPPPPVEMLNVIFTDMNRLMLAPMANNQHTFPNNANMTAHGSIHGLLHTPVFHGGNPSPSYGHHQSGFGTSNPFSNPSVMPQHGRHNQMSANYSPRAPHNVLYQQGYQQPPPSYGGWPQNNNNSYRRPPEQFGSQYNSGNRGGGANFQGMDPRVQNLFASAPGQALMNDAMNQGNRRK